MYGHIHGQSHKQHSQSEALLNAPPLPALLLFAAPIILGNIFQQLYNIVDAIAVGQFLGDLPLSGISVASPAMDVFYALLLGGSIGIGVLVAQICGAAHWERLRRVHATALVGGTVLTLLLSAFGFIFMQRILLAQGTSVETVTQAMRYLRIILAGLVFCFLYNYYAALLRSYGNSRTPFVVLLISSVLHALLDVLLCGVFRLGIYGVACSTVFCQIVSTVWLVVFTETHCPPLRLLRRSPAASASHILTSHAAASDASVAAPDVSDSPVTASDTSGTAPDVSTAPSAAASHSDGKPLHFDPSLAALIFGFAWAAALQQAIVMIGRFLVQGMLTPLGDTAVTGYNMGMRVEQFLFCFSQGISAAMVVGVSQNLGHGDLSRVRRFYRCGVCAEIVLIAFLATLCKAFAPQIIGLFSDNADVVAAGVLYTGTMAYIYIFAFLGEVIQGYFRGIGRLRLTMFASLLQVILRVTLSYLLIPLWGIRGICAAVASGWILLVALEGTYSIFTHKLPHVAAK